MLPSTGMIMLSCANTLSRVKEECNLYLEIFYNHGHVSANSKPEVFNQEGSPVVVLDLQVVPVPLHVMHPHQQQNGEDCSILERAQRGHAHIQRRN